MFKDTSEGETNFDPKAEEEARKHSTPALSPLEEEISARQLAGEAPFDDSVDREPKQECCDTCFKWGKHYGEYVHPCHNTNCPCHKQGLQTEEWGRRFDSLLAEVVFGNGDDTKLKTYVADLFQTQKETLLTQTRQEIAREVEGMKLQAFDNLEFEKRWKHENILTGIDREMFARNQALSDVISKIINHGKNV